MYTPDQYIRHLRAEFHKLPWKDSVASYLIFGSLVNIPSLTLNKDIDLCIVLSQRSELLMQQVREYLAANFIRPDVTVYYKDELDGPLPFRDIGNGVFALEYLALGKTIFGRNLFIEMLQRASAVEYRRSLLEKMYDYVLRLRRAFLVEPDPAAKFAYVDKYTQRLVLDLLIYLGVETMESLLSMNRDDIYRHATSADLMSAPIQQRLIARSSIHDVLDAYEEYLESVSLVLISLPRANE